MLEKKHNSRKYILHFMFLPFKLRTKIEKTR
jgi:hypothetical protein